MAVASVSTFESLDVRDGVHGKVIAELQNVRRSIFKSVVIGGPSPDIQICGRFLQLTDRNEHFDAVNRGFCGDGHFNSSMIDSVFPRIWKTEIMGQWLIHDTALTHVHHHVSGRCLAVIFQPDDYLEEIAFLFLLKGIKYIGSLPSDQSFSRGRSSTVCGIGGAFVGAVHKPSNNGIRNTSEYSDTGKPPLPKWVLFLVMIGVILGFWGIWLDRLPRLDYWIISAGLILFGFGFFMFMAWFSSFGHGKPKD